jgi:hypothetical protein
MQRISSTLIHYLSDEIGRGVTWVKIDNVKTNIYPLNLEDLNVDGRAKLKCMHTEVQAKCR